MTITDKNYTDLSKLETFTERYEYLKLDGKPGKETFGVERYLNQKFYRTREWKSVRDYVIVRDSGCDLGVLDRPIQGKVIVHHMKPITMWDIEHRAPWILDPEYLICVSHDTHNGITFLTDYFETMDPVVRRENDTTPWK